MTDKPKSETTAGLSVGEVLPVVAWRYSYRSSLAFCEGSHMTEAQRLVDECKRLAEEFADARYEEAKDQDHGGGRTDTEYCRAEVARTRSAMTEAIDRLASMIPGSPAEKVRDGDKSLETQIRELLKGIDTEECFDPDGWWQTSTGVEFGTGKLRELLALVEASRRT